MKPKTRDALDLGPDVIRYLLPHRRPFVFVDRITHFSREPEAALWAQKYISSNEDVFNGHFPGWHIWPGVCTQEGLGQCINLLMLLDGLCGGCAGLGVQADEFLELLRNLERGSRLHPGHAAEKNRFLFELLASAGNIVGMSAATEMKFLKPVFGGSRLDYYIRQTHRLDNIARFHVEASVDDALVAKGVMSSTVGITAPGMVRPDGGV